MHVGSETEGHFAIGGHVLGHTSRLAKNNDRHDGFQEYTVLWSNMAARIRASVSYEKADVLPLGVLTASAALFQWGTLNLPAPHLDPVLKQFPKTVLIWGGTSSVRGGAIQLAVAAGFDAIAIASSRNFDIMKRLGVISVINYSSGNVVGNLKRVFGGRRLAGAGDAIGKEESLKPILEAVSQINGDKKVVTTADWEDEKLIPPGVEAQRILAIDIREKRERTETKRSVRSARTFFRMPLQLGSIRYILNRALLARVLG